MRATINFYLTWKCNFTCAHCIHECGPQGNHMTLEQIDYGMNFIRWLHQRNVPVVVIGTTGGEALLHPVFWTEYMPRLCSIRDTTKLQYFELHTNASVPIHEDQRTFYSKFFSTVYVGHDKCHRQFAPLNSLHLQDYSDISKLVNVSQNDYIVGGKHCLYLRIKGRATESLANGRLFEHPLTNSETKCTWHNDHGQDCLHFTFTPDHVNHCGEKSHPLPPLPLGQGNIDEGQFHPYNMDFEKLLHAGLDYTTKYSGANCSQKCVLKFCSPT